jgi:hypothetical protein
MLRAVCPETQRAEKPSPLPVGFSPRKPTQARCDASTVYSLAGPQSPLDTLADNQNFLFTITLFGDGFRFLPYFVLAASAMGDTSVGPGRGKFEIVSLHAQNPLTGVSHAILSDGEKIVRPQSLPIAWNEADVVAREFSSEADVRIRFLSPTRLIDSDSLVKAPDFGIFFRR